MAVVGRRWNSGPLLLAALVTGGCGGSNAALNPEELPDDIRPAYERFAFHCSRCHTLTRPLTAHIDSLTHWDRYVARMRLMPGSGIGADDERVILRFLYYYSQEVRGVDEGKQASEPATIDSQSGPPASDAVNQNDPGPVTDGEGETVGVSAATSAEGVPNVSAPASRVEGD